VLDNDGAPLDLAAPYETYLPAINRDVRRSGGSILAAPPPRRPAVHARAWPR
jgi:hypothetical protein